MKQTIGLSQFRDAFRDAGREIHFSYEGLGVLFEHLESLESDTGEEIEFDVIALCCEFAEDSAESIAKAYGVEYDEDDDLEDSVKVFLEDEGALVGKVSGGFVYRQF
jgi:hypothetical protein